MAFKSDVLGGKGAENVSESMELRDGDVLRVVRVLDSQSDIPQRILVPEQRKIFLTRNSDGDFVSFYRVGYSEEDTVLSTSSFNCIADVANLSSGPFPEFFWMPMTVLRELMDFHGWTVVERADGTPVDAIRKAVGLAVQLPVVPAVATPGADEATRLGSLAELAAPLVRFGRGQDAPLADADQIEEEVKSAAEKLKEALKSLESVVNLRPEQVGVAGVRGSIQVLLTNMHLLGAAERLRIVALNGHLTQLYNRTQKSGVWEVIKAINEFLALLPKN